jgi:HK97 family phage major capsid protein
MDKVLSDKFDQLMGLNVVLKKVLDQRDEEIKTRKDESADFKSKFEKILKDLVSKEKEINDLKALKAKVLEVENLASWKNVDGKPGIEKARKFTNALLRSHLPKLRNNVETKEYLEKSDYSQKGYSSTADGEGYIFINPEMSAEIQTEIFENSPMRSLARKVTISTGRWEEPYRSGRGNVTWGSETLQVVDSGQRVIDKLAIEVKTQFATVPVPLETLEDSDFDITSLIREDAGIDFGDSEAKASYVGDGNLELRGILTYADGDGFDQIEQIETALSNTIETDDLINLESALFSPWKSNARFQMNKTTLAFLRKLKDPSTKLPLIQPNLQSGLPTTLFGYSILEATDMPSGLSDDDLAVAFGDFFAGYRFVDRLALEVKVDENTLYPSVAFKMRRRVGGGVRTFQAIKLLRIKQ